MILTIKSDVSKNSLHNCFIESLKCLQMKMEESMVHVAGWKCSGEERRKVKEAVVKVGRKENRGEGGDSGGYLVMVCTRSFSLSGYAHFNASSGYRHTRSHHTHMGQTCTHTT